MRHKSGLRKLNRTSASRLALFRNLSVSLIREEAIRTTLPKAKELRRVIERLITLSKKNDNVASRRLAFARLRSREIVTKLFEEIAPRFSQRPGGYVRILKMGFRKGDNAPLAYIELVDRSPEAIDRQKNTKSIQSKKQASQENVSSLKQEALVSN